MTENISTKTVTKLPRSDLQQRLLVKRSDGMFSCFRCCKRRGAFKWPWKKYPKPQSRFLKLPREIRDIIYHLILPLGEQGGDGTRRSISINCSCPNNGLVRRHLPQRNSSEGCATKATAILCTCRQIYLEASDVLYKNWSFRYGIHYRAPTTLRSYDIDDLFYPPDFHPQCAISSSARSGLTYLPHARFPLSMVARFEVMEVFGNLLYSGSLDHPNHDSLSVIELLAKYATSLKFLSVRFANVAYLTDYRKACRDLTFRLPVLLNTFARLTTIDFSTNSSGREGRRYMPVFRSCAKITAELGTWAYLDLSSAEMVVEATVFNDAGINQAGRWLLRK